MRAEGLKVYLYACLDETGRARSGLAASTSHNAVVDDIERNYAGACHIMVRQVPELFAITSSDGSTVVAYGGIDLAKGCDMTGAPYNYIGEAAVGAPFDEPFNQG